MDAEGHLLTFPPNRVWRTYPGGRVLDALAHAPEPADSHFPEDWIGSVTRAVNPDRETIEEGLSTARWDGGEARFKDLLEAAPDYFLGASHVRRFGPQPMVLVKLLDSAVRLHFQCHPTAAFAQQHLGQPAGKAEAYYILAAREGVTQPYVHLGFQRPPSRAELKRMIEEQDLAALEACFDKIPVRPGDVLFIPGGIPHAIGEGILMVEIMEPSDLAVRFEFEKAGYVLPESARFMGRGLDFCLDVFDYRQLSPAEVRAHFMFKPRPRRSLGPDSAQFDLIGPETTPAFQVRVSEIAAPIVKAEESFYAAIVVRGRLAATTARGRTELGYLDKCFVPAGLERVAFEPLDGPVTLLEVFPRSPNAPR